LKLDQAIARIPDKAEASHETGVTYGVIGRATGRLKERRG
jgi:hypothetical protein